MKSTLKRFLSLMLCMCMVMALLTNVTMTAFAATSGTVTGLADENIGLSFTGDADDAWSANGTSIIGAATSTGGTCSDTSHSSTLTITNKKSTTATLSFDYSIEQNSGKIQVDGTEVSSGASFTKELAANESVKVYIQSGSTSAATKITLTNVVLVSDVNATATFVPAENGTYTVDGKLITEEYSNTQSSMTAYQVVATPADGYQFLGWYNLTTGKCIATAATTALNIESDCTVTAKFASKTAALFETGGQRFDDLGDAVSYAQANRQSKITLATDGSISGTYTIPTGITLLIPFDAAGTLYTDAPAAIRTTPTSKPFRTLTMSEGSSITVNGAISLGGRYFAAGGSQQGRPVGDYGYIKMADNSSITVKNGGKLYAWGFISGSGSVLAESGATVYEFYQIADFRGGSASSSMGHGVFPFSQYFVQNIEVPLTLNAGANEVVYSGVYAMSTTYTTSINFIGDTGMFKVESGSFTKDYDEKTDRLVFTVNGEAALNTLSLKLAGMSVDSANYVLPITNNITINIQSGNVTINQDAALLAGVQVNIAEGAGLTVANGKNIYFYDSDEWNSDNFVWGPCKFKSVAYAPGKAYNRTNNDLVDAKMDVNGSVTAIGAIYTTKGGADICSSNGTGIYNQQGTPGTETATYQYNANGNNAVTIPITAAKLHNADGTYTETATASAGDIINYVNGVWGGEEPTELTVTFEANGSTEYPVEGTMEPQTVLEKTDTALNANTFTREGYNFTGWNTEADGTGTSYADGATVNLTENTTLYAQWQFWNGWFTDVNGKQYYKDGELQKTGWTEIDGNTYYLDTETGYAATGIVTLIPAGATEAARCVFDANGVFQKNVTGVYSVGADTYWLNSGIIEEEAGLKRVVKEDGEVNYYYFATQENLDEQEDLVLSAAVNNTVLNGQNCWLHKTNSWLPAWFYYFDENGVILHEDTTINGIQNVGGKLYYYIDGIKAPAGMIRIGDDIYYVNSSAQLIVDQNYYCSRTNDIMEPGYYCFDAEGKMIGASKNGIVEDADGVLRYYVNGTPTYVGLIEINGDFYYVNSKCEVVRNCSYYITWTHGLKEPGYYYFDKDGKLIGAPKHGIVEEDGTLRYYVNNELTYVGLIKIDGYYYYVNSKCEVVHNCTYYVSWTHGLIPEGDYSFDAEGKMIDPPAPEDPTKNGIVAEDGTLYYYVDGVKVYAGLIKIDGDYYYVNSSCKVVTTSHYWVNRTNGLMAAGFYDFGADGKMIDPPVVKDPTKNGIVAEDGTLYYYVDGVKSYAGLIEINGDYYYVNSSCKVVTTYHYWVNHTNGLMPAGFYDFGTDGKMIRK